MTAKQHIERAKDYAAKGDEYYAKAADEIISAREADPTLGYREIGEAIGKSRDWCYKIVRWRTSVADHQHGPFGGQEENEARYARHDKRKVSEILKDRPEALVEAILAGPKDALFEILNALLDSQATGEAKGSVPVKERVARVPKPASLRLEEATFSLWEIGESLMDEVPEADDRLRMLSAARKAKQLAEGIVLLLDTGELDSQFTKFLEEIGAEL